MRVAATARLCIAGQAPGRRVHSSGLPFDDASGATLRHWMGVTADEFYDGERIAFLPMGFCYPGRDARGGDLPPRRECAPAWRNHLFAGMDRLKLILCVGQYARSWHLPEFGDEPMAETVSRWRECLASERLPRIVPLPHPSWRNRGWVRRNPWFERDLLPDLRAEVRSLLA